MPKTKSKRISFSIFDAMHLYDLAHEQFQVSKKEGVCAICVLLKERLGKIIGEKEVRDIGRRAKKYPYH